MQKTNKHIWLPFLESTSEYIKDLNNLQGKQMLQTQYKAGFLGFLVGSESMKGIYQDLAGSNTMKYLHTYKLSQDHLELFFGAVRSAGVIQR